MSRRPEPRSAERVHVPAIECLAINQRPKTSDHREVKLYRYEGTLLHQWFSKVGESVFEDPFAEPFIIDLPTHDLDHRQRAIDFHRRAQTAEGLEIRARHEAWFWHRAWRRILGNRNTLKRKLNRVRAQLWSARHTDPITRIVEIGRMFP